MLLNPGKPSAVTDTGKARRMRRASDICVQSLLHILAVEILGRVRLRARVVPHRHLHKIELIIRTARKETIDQSDTGY